MTTVIMVIMATDVNILQFCRCCCCFYPILSIPTSFSYECREKSHLDGGACLLALWTVVGTLELACVNEILTSDFLLSVRLL